MTKPVESPGEGPAVKRDVAVVAAAPAAGAAPGGAARRFRWKPGAVIVAAGVAVDLGLWWWHASDRTMQVMLVLNSLILFALALLVWWTGFSGLTWRARGTGLAAVALAFGLFLGLVRIDGFSGELLPHLQWRWTPTIEEAAEEYRARQAKDVTARESTAGERPADSAAGEADAAPVVSADDWPAYRGAERDGVVRSSVSIRSDWATRPPELKWKHPVGLGWSSFAIVDRYAYTQEQRRDLEAVVCYDVQTGAELWAHTDAVRFSETAGGDGPRATPTYYDGRLYALGATGLLNCLEPLTGRVIWSQDILQDSAAKNLDWGMAGAPLIYDDSVVVNPGIDPSQPAGRAVVAYDRLTGKRQWAVGNDPAGYAAPQLATLSGVRQVLVYHGDGLAGHDASSGAQLWMFPWTNMPKVNASQPIVLNDQQVFIAASYSAGSTLLQVERGADGWSAQPVWQGRHMKLKFNSGVLHEGHVYGIDERILCCVRAADGKVLWKQGRFGYGQMLLVNDLLLIQAESGEVVLVRADPAKFAEVARFQAIEGISWNNPALCRGLLLVRNSQEAACYDLSAGDSARTTARVD